MTSAAATATVRSGAPVGNLRRGEDAASSRGLGTLGFLALVNGRRRRELVLVSSRHVLLAHGAGRGDPVYCPALEARGSSRVVRAASLDPVAKILDEGAEANHRFAYPGEPEREYFVDCACARMLDDSARSDPSAVRRVTRLHPLDVAGARAPRVRKVGAASGMTEGRVVDASARVDEAGRPPRLHNIVIRGDGGPFAEAGDSGALVVNDRAEAIGLVWGRSDRDPTIAYAAHIHPVLDRLGVTMLTGGLA